MHNILISIASTVIAYLLGSISFSRIVSSIVSPGIDLTKTQVPVLGSEEKIEMSAISPTSVRFRLGPKYGLLSSFLDMLKVGIPVAVFHFAFPSTPADYFGAMGGIIGHNWPLYYKFKGGYGQSAIYGALIVLDWIAVLVNVFGTFILFLFVKQVHIATIGGLAFLLPWFYFFRHDPFALVYSGVCLVAYFFRILPDFKATLKIQKKKSTA